MVRGRILFLGIFQIYEALAQLAVKINHSTDNELFLAGFVSKKNSSEGCA
jgi:hypothetical protein